MLTRGLEADTTRGTATGQLAIPIPAAVDTAASKVVPAARRFVRDAGEFATGATGQMRRPS
jgi:hypothetical protein